MDIVIIGAGVAGSVLADLLTARNHGVTVLEQDPRPPRAPGDGCATRTL